MHTHWLSDRQQEEDTVTVTHNICNCLLLTCGNGRYFDHPRNTHLCIFNERNSDFYLIPLTTYWLQIVGESLRLLAIIRKSLK